MAAQEHEVQEQPRRYSDAPLTKHQRAQLVRAYRAQHSGDDDGWVRARTHGERVTLASLYYRHLLERRCHSGAGTSSPAHEYKLPESLYRAFFEAAARRVANPDAGVYRGTDNAEAPMAKQDGSGGVVTAFKGSDTGGTGKRGTGRTAKERTRMAGTTAPPAEEGATPAAAPAAGKKETKPRVEKTSKAAKDARKAMNEHKPAYKAYTDAQAAKAKALKAGDEKESVKQQKVMDKNRVAYTAHRAAYRAYQAAPEK